MTEKDIRDKITKLRVEHNHLSEYQLSLDLGQSKGYIQGIAAGRSLPSMKMFLNICEYFSIEPAEFFEEPMASALERRSAQRAQRIDGRGYGTFAVHNQKNEIREVALSEVDYEKD